MNTARIRITQFWCIVSIVMMSSWNATHTDAAAMMKIDTTLTGNEKDWTFVESDQLWKQRDDGVFLPPIWKILGEADAPGYFKGYSAYADDLTREDYAFLTRPVLADIDLSVDFQIRYAAVVDMGVAFRAQDSQRMYVVVVNDMGRKGYAFHVALWLQDSNGFRQQLAEGIVPHPETSDRLRQSGPRNYEDWIQSSHGWSTLRVRAIGDTINVSIDGEQAFECRDRTYAAGTVGLIARWAVPFRNFVLSGTEGQLGEPWRVLEGTRPHFDLPFDGRIGSYEVFPAVAQNTNGTLYVIANVGQNRNHLGIGIVKSTDRGRTWIEPRHFQDLGYYHPHGAGLSPSLLAHQNGSLSCFFRFKQPDESETVGVARSTDGGQTWSDPKELVTSGKPLREHVDKGMIALYSPPQRLRDGIRLMSGYHVDSSRGHTNALRQDRSAVFRSTDDGSTWTGPHYVDNEKFDCNECMIAELPGGRLQAFMRTLRAPKMWTSFSTDSGLTWSSLEQSDVTGECPAVLGHSSGTIVMGNRGSGIFLKISRDGGSTWQVYRVSPASGMMGMTELDDGRIFIVYHTGYRVPARIRAQFVRITPSGIEPG